MSSLANYILKKCSESESKYFVKPKRITLGYDTYCELRREPDALRFIYPYVDGKAQESCIFYGIPIKIAPKRRNLILIVPDIRRPKLWRPMQDSADYKDTLSYIDKIIVSPPSINCSYIYDSIPTIDYSNNLNQNDNRKPDPKRDAATRRLFRKASREINRIYGNGRLHSTRSHSSQLGESTSKQGDKGAAESRNNGTILRHMLGTGQASEGKASNA